MTTDPRDPLAGKSRAFKAALQAVEDMEAAAASWHSRAKSLRGRGKKPQQGRKAVPAADANHEKDGDT